MENPSKDWPLVSIVTVNFNGLVVTRELLLSLRKSRYPSMEILVVDNGSNQSIDVLREEFPEVTFIHTGNNLGFAGGNNVGFREASGKFILMINNDTEVHPDFLFPLVSKLQGDEGIGAVSPKLLYYYSKGLIQYAGCSEINPYTGRSKFRGNKVYDEGQFNGCCQTNYGHGAALLFRKDILAKTGFMEGSYFLYYEEFDFCEKIKKAGYSIWYIGTSEVYHKESVSVGKDTPLKVYYMTRNRLFFLRRNIDGFRVVFPFLFFAFFSIPKNTFSFLMKRRFDLLGAFYKGFLWNIVQLKDSKPNAS